MRIVDLFRDGAPASIADAVSAMEIILETSRDMWIVATGHLLFNDPLTVDLEETDAIVDDKEREIRRIVKEHVVSAPRSEIQLALAIVSVVQDGERIGDLAKRLGELGSITSKPLISPYTFTLRSARERITEMFAGTLAGLLDASVAEGEKVMRMNEVLKEELRAFVRDIAKAEDVRVEEAVVLASASLMMGRVSSHLSNISSTVVLPFEEIRGAVPSS